jgi:hypothetical protein
MNFGDNAKACSRQSTKEIRAAGLLLLASPGSSDQLLTPTVDLEFAKGLRSLHAIAFRANAHDHVTEN